MFRKLRVSFDTSVAVSRASGHAYVLKYYRLHAGKAGNIFDKVFTFWDAHMDGRMHRRMHELIIEITPPVNLYEFRVLTKPILPLTWILA